MILECKSCQKKFIVPESAITNAGRLVQCSSCGNKWTQFPIAKKTIKKPINFSAKKNVIKQSIKSPSKIKEEKFFSTTEKGKKKIKKKSGPSIYSKEYLEKKHGIKIDESVSRASKNRLNKKTSKSYFGFYSYLILFLFVFTSMVGILNLTSEIIIFNFPVTEVYIEYLFENLNNFWILFKDTFNLY